MLQIIILLLDSLEAAPLAAHGGTGPLRCVCHFYVDQGFGRLAHSVVTIRVGGKFLGLESQAGWPLLSQFSGLRNLVSVWWI